MTFPAALTLAAALAAPPAPSADLLAKGDRIRVRTLGGTTMVGRVLDVDAKTLLFLLPDRREPMHLWLSELECLEVPDGRRSRAREGTLIGLSTAGAALLFGGQMQQQDAFGRSVLFASTGATLGLLIGGLIKTENWKPIGLAAPRVAVLPAPRGVGVQIHLQWRGRIRTAGAARSSPARR